VTQGGEIVFHRSAWSHADTFATLAVGMQVEFEPESSPKGRRTAQITVMP
jgi:cold shock CspA family protein